MLFRRTYGRVVHCSSWKFAIHGYEKRSHRERVLITVRRGGEAVGDNTRLTRNRNSNVAKIGATCGRFRKCYEEEVARSW